MWQDRAGARRRAKAFFCAPTPALALAACLAIAANAPAYAVDEVQVYNAEIAKIGQWTMQQHFNYAINGLKEPDFPGGLVRNHTLNGTPEFAYGVTDWFELGFYLPWAVDPDGRFWSDAGKIRFLFVSPDAAKREFFYGVNFEFSYATPKFSETRWNTEVRPIIGWRRNDWAFIINPILDLSYGSLGDIEFVPAARLEKKLWDDFTVAVEYYTVLGTPGAFPAFDNQEHNIYGVVDFKVGKVDVDFGVGYGLTSSSDRWMTKLILGIDLNEGDEGKSDRTSGRAGVRMAPSNASNVVFR